MESTLGDCNSLVSEAGCYGLYNSYYFPYRTIVLSYSSGVIIVTSGLGPLLCRLIPLIVPFHIYERFYPHQSEFLFFPPQAGLVIVSAILTPFSDVA